MSPTTIKVAGSAVKSHEPERVIVKAQISKKLDKTAVGSAGGDDIDLAGPIAPASERIAAILDPLAKLSEGQTKSLITHLVIGQPFLHTQLARNNSHGGATAKKKAATAAAAASKHGNTTNASNNAANGDGHSAEVEHRDDKDETNDGDTSIATTVVGGTVTSFSKVDIEAEFTPRDIEEWRKCETAVRELSSTTNVSVKSITFTISDETAATMIRQARIEAVQNAKEEAVDFALGLGFNAVECLSIKHTFGPTSGISTLRPQQSRTFTRPRSVSVSVKVDADFATVTSPIGAATATSLKEGASIKAE